MFDDATTDDSITVPCAGGCGTTITSTRASFGLIKKCAKCDQEFWARLDTYDEAGNVVPAGQRRGA